MRLSALAALAAGVLLMGAAAPKDPYAYMEEAEGAKALAFARAENDRSLPQLQNDPRYAGLYADALKIVTAKDRIPNVSFAGDGSFRDFWQDAEHVRGIWRTASVENYSANGKKRSPDTLIVGDIGWQTLLDIDALSSDEHANWVWK